MPQETLVFNLGGKVKTRHETLNGKKYLVVPAVMGVEGVLNGSDGPKFYSAKEWAKGAPTWNMKPVVVNHPEINGKPISACDPVILESRSMGFLLNTGWDDKLKTEAWLDEEKTDKLDKRIMEAINSGKQVEVSTGLHVDNEVKEGEYNGKKYSALAINHRPDHLAVLPDKVGACSIADGAGLLTNEDKSDLTKEEVLTLIQNKQWTEEERQTHPKEDFGDPDRQAFPIEDQEDLHNAASLLHHAKHPTIVKARLKKIAKRKGLKVPVTWEEDEKETRNELYQIIRDCKEAQAGIADTLVTNANAVSYQDTQKSLSQAMVQQYGTKDGYWPGWIEDIYNDFYIYSMNGKWYQAAYSYNADKGKGYTIQHPNEHQEVVKHTEYRDKEGKTVAPRGQKIGAEFAAVGHTGSGGGSQVKEPQSVIPGHGKHELPGAKTAVGTSGVHTTRNEETSTMTTEEYINNAPPDVKDMLQEGIEARNQERNRLVELITNAKGNVFKKEDLEKKPISDLRAIASIIVTNMPVEERRQKVPNYAGAGLIAPVTTNTGKTEPQFKVPEPLPLPVINFASDQPTLADQIAAKLVQSGKK